MPTVNYPSFQALGWIPYFETINDPALVNYQAYSKNSFLRRLACTMFFLSGNEPPPGMLSTEALFDAYLKTRNFRGALTIRDIAIEFMNSGGGKGTCQTLSPYECVGYTPAQITLLGRKMTLGFFRGETDRADGDEIKPAFNFVDKDHVFFSHRIRFRIGKIGQYFAKLLVNHYPPFVELRVNYLVHRNGEVKVSVAGTCLPSQQYVILGKTIWTHDMLTSSEQEIKAFFEPKGRFSTGATYQPVRIL